MNSTTLMNKWKYLKRERKFSLMKLRAYKLLKERDMKIQLNQKRISLKLEQSSKNLKIRSMALRI